MKKLVYIASICIFLLPFTSLGQSRTDVIDGSSGLIVYDSDSFTKGDFIEIFNADGSLWHRFTYFYDDSDGDFEYANDDFVTYSFHPDYFILAMKMVNEDASRYEVIVNEGTGKTKFVLKDSKGLKFSNWSEYVVRMFAVGFDQNINPVRRAPAGAILDPQPQSDLFHPKETKGDWMRVEFDSSRSEADKGGWIRWRENGKLIIELFPLC